MKSGFVYVQKRVKILERLTDEFNQLLFFKNHHESFEVP